MIATPGQTATTDPQLQTKKAPPKLPQEFEAVALLPLLAAAEDIRPEVADTVLKELLESVDALPGNFRSISPTDVTADLAQYELDVSLCDRDVACLAQAGRYARAQKAMEIRIIPWGGSLLLQARLIDTVAVKKIGSFEEPLESDSKNLAEQIRRLATQLLAPKAYVGNLLIRSNMEHVRIYLDDALITRSNTVQLMQVPAGVHVLRVVCEGYPDVHRFVDVHFGRNNTVTLHAQQQALSFESVLDAPLMTQAQAPPIRQTETHVASAPKIIYPSWRTWAGTSVGGAGVLTLAAAGYLAFDLRRTSDKAQSYSNMLADLAVGDPQSLAWRAEIERLNRRGQKLESWTNLALEVGGGLVLLGAGGILWDLLRKPSLSQTTPSLATLRARTFFQPRVCLAPWTQHGVRGLLWRGTF